MKRIKDLVMEVRHGEVGSGDGLGGGDGKLSQPRPKLEHRPALLQRNKTATIVFVPVCTSR